MCMLPDNEPIPTRSVHELEPHVSPIPSRPVRKWLADHSFNFALFWSMEWNRVCAWASRIHWERVFLWGTCLCVVAIASMALAHILGVA